MVLNKRWYRKQVKVVCKILFQPHSHSLIQSNPYYELIMGQVLQRAMGSMSSPQPQLHSSDVWIYPGIHIDI